MNKFKKLILEKDMHYSDISKLTGISERSIIRYANGHALPKYENAIKIWKIFSNENVNFLDFFG